MGGFVGTPSPWYHQVVVLPLYVLFLAGTDEFVFRRHPIAGLYITLVGMICVPTWAALGVFNSPLFTTIKFFLIAIPVCAILLMRLGNYDNFQSKYGFHHKLYEFGCNHLKDPPFEWYTKSRHSGKQRIVDLLFYLFLVSNMLEAMLFQTALLTDQSLNNGKKLAALFNVICGFCIIISAPLPCHHGTCLHGQRNRYRTRFWFIDWESKYKDYLMFLPYKPYYIGAYWIIIYTIWDWHFGSMVLGPENSISLLIHLLPPMLTSIYKKERYSLYIQSRAFTLMLYIAFLIPIVNKVLLTDSEIWSPVVANTDVLLAWGAFDMSVGIIYATIWLTLFWNHKIVTPNMVREDTQRNASGVSMHDFDDLEELQGELVKKNTKRSKLDDRINWEVADRILVKKKSERHLNLADANGQTQTQGQGQGQGQGQEHGQVQAAATN